MIQTILTISTICLAITFLGIRIYKRFFSKKSGCDGCAVSQVKVK